MLKRDGEDCEHEVPNYPGLLTNREHAAYQAAIPVVAEEVRLYNERTKILAEIEKQSPEIAEKISSQQDIPLTAEWQLRHSLFKSTRSEMTLCSRSVDGEQQFGVANHHNGTAQLQSIGRIIVFVLLLVFLPTWGNKIVSIVSDTVTNVLKVDPAKIHDEYQAALQLQKSSDGNSSWWEKLVSFTNIMESLISVFFLLLGWVASAIEWWAYILQTAILFIGYALSPIFIGMMAFPSLQNTGRNYLLNLLGVMLWPLGWGIAGLITQGVIDFMTDQSFLNSGQTGGTIYYSLQNLMGLAFLGIWIIFSTIAAPVVIQRAFTNGVSAISGLFSGAFAAGSAAGMAGFMSLASSMGGKAVPIGKGSLSAGGMKQAAAFGGAAAMAGVVAGATAAETLATASMNQGAGGSSLIGSLSQMNDANKRRASSGASNKSQKSADEGFPQNDPAGDRTVADLINKSKNPEV